MITASVICGTCVAFAAATTTVTQHTTHITTYFKATAIGSDVENYRPQQDQAVMRENTCNSTMGGCFHTSSLLQARHSVCHRHSPCMWLTDFIVIHLVGKPRHHILVTQPISLHNRCHVRVEIGQSRRTLLELHKKNTHKHSYHANCQEMQMRAHNKPSIVANTWLQCPATILSNTSIILE